MPDKTVSPNQDEARKILKELWNNVSLETETVVDPTIDKLMKSQFVSIRFSLPTQLLGKLTDSALNCLCLQKGNGEDESQWDPRGFAAKVLVPWVAENQSVLGTSSDPYVSKPLRKQYLEANPGNVKGEAEWKSLFQVLEEVEEKNDPEFTKLRFIQVLRSVKALYSELSFQYYSPERISLEQTQGLVKNFLSESSGGDRGLAVAAALFETFGKFFKLYSDLKRNVINASDQATGSAGDIECLDENGNLRLAIEVKERNLTLTDVRTAIIKARGVSLTEVLLNAPGIVGNENEQINELISRTWASGTNIYHLTIDDLITVGLFLTGEDGRIDFVKNVGAQLDKYNTQPVNRKRWKDLLEGL